MKAKKLLSLVLAAGMTLSIAAPAVNADDEIKVLLDGKELTFDVLPQLINDRTLVPFRGIFEALGYEVDWIDAYEGIVALNKTNNTSINMAIGRNTAFLLGEGIHANPDAKNEIDKNDPSIPQGVIEGSEYYQVDLDVPPQLIDDRTFVPVRAVSEMSGYKVDWEESINTVVITSPADIMTGPGPALPEATTNPATQTAPGPVKPAETTNPATQTAPGPAEQQYTLEYDSSRELLESEMKNFEMTSITKDADGKYVIDYKLTTFLEGKGDVTVTFNCLDASGKVVDTWTRTYHSVDYTRTPQKDTVTVSGDTVKIEYVMK